MILELISFSIGAPNNLLNSPECGVTTTFCPSMIGSISLTRELASKEIRTFLSSNDFTSNFYCLNILYCKSIPIVAESISTGTWPNSLFVVPRVNLESAIGITIKSGEIGPC